MSTLKVNNIKDASGGTSNLSIDGAAKAWLNMNAEPAESIRDSLNVSSFTDNGTGDFTINFATALANTNYLVVNSASRGQDSGTDVCSWAGVHSKTTSSFGMGVFQTNSGFSATISRSNLVELLDIVVFGD
mgnify:CR=1 FL=1